MELKTRIYNNMKKAIPKEASQTVVYVNISDTSYEIFFYCLMPDMEYKQCYELAEENIIDASALDEIFEQVSKIIQTDNAYHFENNNLFTFIIDASGIKMKVEYLEKNARMYRVKKKWTEEFLHL